MATLQASKVLEALTRAKQVGRVEVPVTVDGCPLVLQNLTTTDYNDIDAETSPLDEVEYLHAFQEGHICRSIVEIGDQDLRQVQFIEDEVPTGSYSVSAHLPNKKAADDIAAEVRKKGGEAGVAPPDGEPRLIKLERHAWIKNHLIPGWGREAVTVTWRKFTEVLAAAEEKSKQGIVFQIPDETAEERLRRLVTEMKETTDELPLEMVEAIYAEAGLFSTSSQQEVDVVNEKLRGLSDEAAPEQPQPVAAAPEPSPVAQAPQRAPEPTQQPAPAGSSPQELMQNRQPMNRQPVSAPVPTAQAPVPAARRAPVPDQIRRAAAANSASMQQGQELRGRSAEIANLESQVDPDITTSAPAVVPRAEGIPELSKPVGGVDGAEARTIINVPPKIGINPRFKPPQG